MWLLSGVSVGNGGAFGGENEPLLQKGVLSVRIQYASDLYLDHGHRPLPPGHVRGDVLVLAGNLQEKIPFLRDYLTTLAQAKVPVLFVPGDREAMALPWDNSLGAMRALIPDGPIILDRVEILIDGVRFLGCTLWNDVAGGVSVKEKPFLKQFWSLESLERHRNDRAWLLERLSLRFSGPTVVVTHFAPSTLSLPEDYIDGAPDSPYFSGLESMICGYRPDLWIHGHTPLSVDYRIWKTRIVSNPFGSLGEKGELRENPFFSPEKTVVL